MKVTLVAVLCTVAVAIAHPNFFAADTCEQEDNCLAANGCRCVSQSSPIAIEDTPQFVTFAFNDAVTDNIFELYLNPLLIGRTNNDGKQIGATFYVPHEYTDYARVRDLYNAGFDIAVHSISKDSLSSYWQTASVATLIDEFRGQREIISNFANVPINDIIGARTPNLQINGDRTFEAYKQSGIKFDNSWTAMSQSRFFPYSLDFRSSQPCQIGACPTESFEGVWVLPIIDHKGTDSIECNSVLGCTLEAESAEDVTNWLLTQFERHYNDNKAPLTFNINSAWFAISEYNQPGFVAFLDLLQAYDDVFVVSHASVLEWAQNPVAASEYSTPTTDRSVPCEARSCELMKDQEYRYMKSCVNCPEVFPWVGNPLGLAVVPTNPPTEPTTEPTDAPTEPTEETEEPTEETEEPTEEPTDPTEEPEEPEEPQEFDELDY